jgi:hypothetical protein
MMHSNNQKYNDYVNLEGIITIATALNCVLQHRTNWSYGTSTGGEASSLGDEIYTTIFIQKIN